MKKNTELCFNDFKKMAKNNSLSLNEKIGFPNSYRDGFEKVIIEDISKKLDLDIYSNLNVLDIGCGCSTMTRKFIKYCLTRKQNLSLIDSTEMLDQLPKTNIKKYPGYFPDMPLFIRKYKGKFDRIIVYSVLHYIFFEGNVFSFIHQALDLLKSGGKLLIGDIPNISKKKRLLNSKEGLAFKKNYKKAMKDIGNTHIHAENEIRIDDSLVFSLMIRFRNFECETYLFPQPSDLPMANRREDILIVKR